MLANSELYREIQPYLHPDEEVLWMGRPMVNSVSAPLYPVFFSLFFVGFSIFWMIGASAVGGLFGLFGIPFLCIGVGFLYSATIGRKNGLKQSLYAVTDTRAIIVVTLPRKGTTCKEYIFANLPSVNLENVKNDLGTIRFEELYVYHYDYGRYNRRRGTTYVPERELTTAFLMIENVHSVYHMISERLGK